MSSEGVVSTMFFMQISNILHVNFQITIHFSIFSEGKLKTYFPCAAKSKENCWKMRYSMDKLEPCYSSQNDNTCLWIHWTASHVLSSLNIIHDHFCGKPGAFSMINCAFTREKLLLGFVITEGSTQYGQLQRP